MSKQQVTIHPAEVACKPPTRSVELHYGGIDKGKDFIERIAFIGVPSNGHPESGRYVNVNAYRVGGPNIKTGELYEDCIDDRISLQLNEIKEFHKALGEVIKYTETGCLIPEKQGCKKCCHCCPCKCG